MPLFEFRCPDCAHDFELLIRPGDDAACPKCGRGKVQKLLSETAAPTVGMGRALPIASDCPPGNAPCSPTCCRL